MFQAQSFSFGAIHKHQNVGKGHSQFYSCKSIYWNGIKRFSCLKIFGKEKRVGSLRQLRAHTDIAQESGIFDNLIKLCCGFISSLDLELQFYYCPKMLIFKRNLRGYLKTSDFHLKCCWAMTAPPLPSKKTSKALVQWETAKQKSYCRRVIFCITLWSWISLDKNTNVLQC